MLNRKTALLLLLGILILAPGLSRITMLRQQELRVTLTAKNMAEGGSWLLPVFREQPRYEKPPLAYWLTAIGQKITGQTASETVARTPTFIFSLLLLLLIYYGGKYLLDEATGLLAAVLTVTMFLFARYGQLAETDMILCFFTSLSTLALFQTTRASTPLHWWILAGLCSGFGFMTKGPAAVVMPVAAWLAYVLMYKPARDSFRWLPLVCASLICTVLSGWWYLAVYLLQSDIAQTVGHELTTVVAKGGHHKPFYYYLTKVPAAMLPWGLLLPFALYSAFRKTLAARGYARPPSVAKRTNLEGECTREPRHVTNSKLIPNLFLLIWWATTFLILSLISNKQEHYTVLLLIPSTLLLAVFIRSLLDNQHTRVFFSYKVFTCILLLTLSIFGIVLLFWAPENPAGQRFTPRLLGVLLSIFSTVTLMTVLRTKPWTPRTVVKSALPIVILFWIYIFSLHPHHRPENIIKRFVASIDHQLPAESTLYVTGRKFETLEFYLNHPVHSVPSAIGTWQTMNPGDALIMINDKSFSIDPNEISSSPTYATNWLTSSCLLFVK